MSEILSIAEEFLKEVNIDVPIVIDNNLPARAGYLYQENLIKINEVEISSSYENYASSLNDYLIIILCHELGHYLDKSLEETHKEITERLTKMDTNEFTGDDVLRLYEINYSMENKAKENGLVFVPKNLISEYELLNKYNLMSTDFDIERRIMLYQHNTEVIRHMEKVVEVQAENRKLRDKNMELMKENFELRFGRKLEL